MIRFHANGPVNAYFVGYSGSTTIMWTDVLRKLRMKSCLKWIVPVGRSNLGIWSRDNCEMLHCNWCEFSEGAKNKQLPTSQSLELQSASGGPDPLQILLQVRSKTTAVSNDLAELVSWIPYCSSKLEKNMFLTCLCKHGKNLCLDFKNGWSGKLWYLHVQQCWRIWGLLCTWTLTLAVSFLLPAQQYLCVQHYLTVY